LLFTIDHLAVGGSQKQLYYILKNINRHKFTIFVFHFHEREPRWEIFRTLKHVTFTNHGKSTLFLPGTIHRILKIIKENNVHIVYSFSPRTNVSTLIASIYAKIPLKIVTGEFSDSTLKTGIQRLKTYHYLKYADYVTTASQFHKEKLALQGHNEKKIKVIQKCTDTEFFSPEKLETKTKKKLFGRIDPFVISYVGRLDFLQNNKLFFNGTRKICSSIENAIFLIAGDGKYRRKWIKQTEKMKMTNRFLFTGFRNDVKEIFSVSDVIISLRTDSAACQNSLLEAMSTGKPVIAPRTEANLEIIQHGTNGLLFSPNYDTEFADAVIRLFKDKNLAVNLGKNARKTVEKVYNVNETIKAVEEILY